MSASRSDFAHGVKRHTPLVVQAAVQGETDWRALALDVLAIARDLGFVRAGVASVEPFDVEVTRLEAFIESGFAGGMSYLGTRARGQQLVRADPAALMPGTGSAVSVALPYSSPGRAVAPGGFRVASYALGADYHLVLKDLLLELADRIAERVGRPVLARACVDSAPLLERDLARRAGFVFLGKNTLAIAPGAGSHFLLGELLIDLPLPSLSPLLPDGCGSCTACLDVCPTEAFVEPFRLDATKCISYLTIESSEDVPRELRAKIGDRAFGCDECQSVCPYNAKADARRPHPALSPSEELSGMSAATVLQMGSSSYKRLVKGSALGRASRNQLARNAAIVLGNSGEASAVGPLLKAVERHPSAQVRAHAAWALVRLATVHRVAGARDAMPMLQASPHEEVRQEADVTTNE